MLLGISNGGSHAQSAVFSHDSDKEETLTSLDAHPDLQRLLKLAHERVLERGNIWCQRSLGVESSVGFRKGLVLGGAISPFYLLETPLWGAVQKKVPWTLSVTRARILVAEALTSSLAQWIPLFEELAKNAEALLLITPEVQHDELLAFFIVNAHAKSVVCCPIKPCEVYAGNLRALATKLMAPQVMSTAGKIPPYLSAGDAPPPQSRESLPLAGEVWVRSDASLVLPESGEQWAPLLSEVAIINVGGKTFEDQGEHLRLMTQAVQSIAPGLMLSLEGTDQPPD